MYWLAGLAAAGLAVALFAPVRLRAGVVKEDTAVWSVEVEWLFGLVVFRRSDKGAELLVAGLRRKLAFDRTAEPGPKTGWRDRLAGSERWRRWFTHQRRRAIGRLLRDVWQAMAFTVRGSGWYGFADPAATAWLHAALCAAQALPGMGLRAEPDFCREGWGGRLEAAASMRLVDMFVPLMRFAAAAFIRPVMEKYIGGRTICQEQR